MNIASAEENDFVAKLDPKEDLWIGLSYNRYYYMTEGSFWDNTGLQAQYTNYHEGEANSAVRKCGFLIGVGVSLS